MLRKFFICLFVVTIFIGSKSASAVQTAIDQKQSRETDTWTSTVDISITDTKSTGSEGGIGTNRIVGYKGTVDTEFTPPTIYYDTITKDQAATDDYLRKICDGGDLVPVAPNVIIRCNIASDTTADPPPQAVENFAKQYFRSVDLPVPTPEISAHNGGICGVTHSLDLHIPIEKIYKANNTNFGDITLHAYGNVQVNWGDNTRIDHYKTSGGPYPHSDITHIWNNKGFYNITTTINWTAVVTIGPYEGQNYEIDLDGLTTQGQINNFHVWEAQAVIKS